MTSQYLNFSKSQGHCCVFTQEKITKKFNKDLFFGVLIPWALLLMKHVSIVICPEKCNALDGFYLLHFSVLRIQSRVLCVL